MENLEVNCYSGHSYAERPCSFRWEGVAYEITEIEKSWLEPDERHFLVRTGDNKLFKLCYNTIREGWSLIEILRGKQNVKRRS